MNTLNIVNLAASDNASILQIVWNLLNYHNSVLSMSRWSKADLQLLHLAHKRVSDWLSGRESGYIKHYRPPSFWTFTKWPIKGNLSSKKGQLLLMSLSECSFVSDLRIHLLVRSPTCLCIHEVSWELDACYVIILISSSIGNPIFLDPWLTLTTFSLRMYSIYSRNLDWFALIDHSHKIMRFSREN